MDLFLFLFFKQFLFGVLFLSYVFFSPTFLKAPNSKMNYEKGTDVVENTQRDQDNGVLVL